MKRIVALNSHPIQYFVPLYQKMAADQDIDLTVWYYSSHGATTYFDKEFGVAFQWNIPMLEGYRYEYISKNPDQTPPSGGFFSTLYWSVIPKLWRMPKSTILIYGWNSVINWLVIIFGRLFGHTITLRCDIPVMRETLYSGWKKWLRVLIFRYILFPWVNYFLYIGQQNKAFYLKYGASLNKLIFTPFAVDNDRFSQAYNKLDNKTSIRNKLGLPVEKRIFVYSGKLIHLKQPLLLVEAFKHLSQKQNCLLLVGDGELRGEIEQLAKQYNLDIRISGFVNQLDIEEYYAASDIFVMPSRLEAWGLSVNEAMNFNLPLILSDHTGCAEDLLNTNKNGYIFQFDKIEDLKACLVKMADLPKEQLDSMGAYSGTIIKDYSYIKFIQSIKKIA